MAVDGSASESMHACVARGRALIEGHTLHRLDDRHVLCAVVASSTREPADALGFFFSRRVAKALTPLASRLGIQAAEFDAMCSVVQGTSPMSATPSLVRERMERHATRLAAALRFTLAEKTQSARWTSESVRATAMVAFYFRDSDELFSRAIGGVMRSDARRIDALRSHVEGAMDTATVCTLTSHLVEMVGGFER